MAERALLAALGGTCHSPVATECVFTDGMLTMRATIFTEDGAERVDASAEFSADDLDAPAALARDLLSRASPKIRQHFTGSD